MSGRTFPHVLLSFAYSCPSLEAIRRTFYPSLMTVYVDSARHPFKGHIMCHMTADTLEELHAMADRIAMKREWFQAPPKASFPHYDVPEPRRALAIRYGAVEVDNRTGLHFAARLGIEWAQIKQDDIRHIRYTRTIKRTARFVPVSLGHRS